MNEDEPVPKAAPVAEAITTKYLCKNFADKVETDSRIK